MIPGSPSGDNETGINLFFSAKKQNGDDPDAWLVLADWYEDAGKPDLAKFRRLAEEMASHAGQRKSVHVMQHLAGIAERMLEMIVAT